MPGHSCIGLTALPCPLTKLLLLLLCNKWRQNIKDPKAHMGMLRTKMWQDLEVEYGIAPIECHGLRTSPHSSRMLNPSRKRTIADQSVLLFSGSHSGYWPDPTLIWSGITFITALAQINFFSSPCQSPAHTNWLCHGVVFIHVKLIL